jgi:hypothetical protein
VDLLPRRVSGKLAGAAATPSPLGTLPATYAGVLPCADCPGIEGMDTEQAFLAALAQVRS